MGKHACEWTSVRAWLVLLTGVLIVSSGVAKAQAPQTGTQQGQAMGMMKVDEGQASAMMAERQKMMAAMQATGQKLQDLVAKMDAARGGEKVDAVAAVVKELVAQRTDMSGRMMMTQDRMMGHMMQHMMLMQGGMMSMMNRGSQSGAMQSLENCPVMKGLVQEGAGGQSQKK